jgi:hypothetical protein
MTHGTMRRALFLASALWPVLVRGEARSLPFSDGGWKLDGPRVSTGIVEGRDALQTETGFAVRGDAAFENGTLEFDVEVTRRRSFVFVSFRIHDDGTREEFYLRPHKSSLPDSVQYAPVYQEESAWQLYHGPGGTAAIAFEPGTWTHVRVVVAGTRAAFFVGDGDKPVLIVPRLAGAPGPGAIGVGAYTPPGTPVAGPVAVFSNVTLRPEPDPVDWASGPTFPDPGPGTIRAWAVSPALVPQDGAGVPALPAVTSWTKVAVEPERGLLALDRHVTRPKDDRPAVAAARVHVTAAAAGTRAFELGFSDIATVFLNGRPIFTGDARYSFDRPRRDGLIGFDQARLYLPLVAGDNELVVLVSDVFGGWGLMGRFVDPQALTVDAR